MKIIIEERGSHVMVSFPGESKHFDRIKLLMMATTETLVDSIVPDLPDEQLNALAGRFADAMRASVIALYKLDAHDRGEKFTGKEAAFLSKLFGL